MDTYKKTGTIDLGDKGLSGESFIRPKTAVYDFETDTLTLEVYFAKDASFEITDSRTFTAPDKLTAQFRNALLLNAGKLPQLAGAVKV